MLCKMNKNKLGYCDECGDLVEFSIGHRKVEEEFYGEQIEYEFDLGVCKECGCEVATDIDYNSRKSITKVLAFNALGGKQLRLE